MTSHQLLRQQFAHALEKRQTVVVVMVQVAYGRDGRVVRRDRDCKRGNLGKPTVLEGTLKDRALVELVLSRKTLDLEVVEHG